MARPARTACIECGGGPIVKSGRCREHWNAYIRKWRKQRWRAMRKAAAPESVHPLVHSLFEIARSSGVTWDHVHRRSGIGESTVRQWRTKCVPTVANLDAVLNCLGYELTIQSRSTSVNRLTLSTQVKPVLLQLATD